MTGHFDKGAWKEDEQCGIGKPFMRMEFYVAEDESQRQKITMWAQFRDVDNLGKPGTPLEAYARVCITAIGEAAAALPEKDKIAMTELLHQFLRLVT